MLVTPCGPGGVNPRRKRNPGVTSLVRAGGHELGAVAWGREWRLTRPGNGPGPPWSVSREFKVPEGGSRQLSLIPLVGGHWFVQDRHYRAFLRPPLHGDQTGSFQSLQGMALGPSGDAKAVQPSLSQDEGFRLFQPVEIPEDGG